MNIIGAKSDLALHATALAPTRGRDRTLALWTLQTILIFMFAIGGLMKLGSAHSMVHMFAQIGAGQWLRYTPRTPATLAEPDEQSYPPHPDVAATGWSDRPPARPGSEGQTEAERDPPAQRAIT
jgi:hypothetical protein